MLELHTWWKQYIALTIAIYLLLTLIDLILYHQTKKLLKANWMDYSAIISHHHGDFNRLNIYFREKGLSKREIRTILHILESKKLLKVNYAGRHTSISMKERYLPRHFNF